MCTFRCVESGVEITGAKRVIEHVTRLLTSLSSLEHHLVPRVWLLMIRFTPLGSRSFCFQANVRDSVQHGDHGKIQNEAALGICSLCKELKTHVVLLDGEVCKLFFDFF